MEWLAAHGDFIFIVVAFIGVIIFMKSSNDTTKLIQKIINLNDKHVNHYIDSIDKIDDIQEDHENRIKKLENMEGKK
jgi:hypothetical protein